MQMLTGWKVMRRVGGRLASALAGSQRWRGNNSNRHDGSRVYYRVLKTTRAPARKPLAVFDSQEAAVAWAAPWTRRAGTSHTLEVWQCSYAPCAAPGWVDECLVLPRGTQFATAISLCRRRSAVRVSGL